MGNSHGKLVAYSDQGINLKQFKLQRIIGKGAFGKVRIVERKDTGLTFALKYIRKEDAVRAHSVRNLIRERRMLQQLAHPFLCNLRYSFQDVEYIYIVVDLMTGGDLRFHLTRRTFTEEAIQFWIAQLACALRYIHSQGIVHRDVKPDNVLLDSNGHVHLTDFNVASEFQSFRLLTGKSGTMAYLAPEVIDGRGYRSEVDWWSLGVTFYECIYGKRPFEGKSHNLLAEAIKKNQPKYYATDPAVSSNCLSAISALLETDTTIRIGASSWQSFITHPFFEALDFEALERKEVKPVFQPSSEKTNFDASYDLEELLLEEAPLEARTRKQKPRGELKVDASEKEIKYDELHRLMETMFEPFDYTTVPGYDQRNLLPPSNHKVTTSRSPSTDNITPMTSGPHGPVENHIISSSPQSSAMQPSYSADHSLHSVEHDEFTYAGNNFAPPGTFTPFQRTLTHTVRPRQSHYDLCPSRKDFLDQPSNNNPLLTGPHKPLKPSHSSFGLNWLPHLHLQRPKTSATSEARARFSPTASRRSSNAFREPLPLDGMRTKTGGAYSKSSGALTDHNSEKDNTGDLTADEYGARPFTRTGSSGPSNSASSGILSLFSKRKGRDKSPKPGWPGVLGKEGARVIIS